MAYSNIEDTAKPHIDPENWQFDMVEDSDEFESLALMWADACSARAEFYRNAKVPEHVQKHFDGVAAAATAFHEAATATLNAVEDWTASLDLPDFDRVA